MKTAKPQLQIASQDLLLDQRSPRQASVTLFPLRYHPACHAVGSSPTEQIVAQLVLEGAAISFSWGYRCAKRVFDIVVSSLLLALLAPLFVIVAIWIRLDSTGPAFFLQERIGHLGRPFRMIKFRTMVNGAQLMFVNSVHKHAGDSRVTRVGSFLRATSLDEVPQLINVFRGQMSLVGPRPEIAVIVREYYEPWQYQRFLVPQGMSGWWQVTGRGGKLLRDHTEDDLAYIVRASFWFDLQIMCMTLGAVLKREGAY